MRCPCFQGFVVDESHAPHRPPQEGLLFVSGIEAVSERSKCHLDGLATQASVL
ncbi:hypothetical protein CKA32_002430 [Geitlerinema sp. FC II]|nr:hypothetical protein CKA32_002430 [Geitlerinema sp. FC II]